VLKSNNSFGPCPKTNANPAELSALPFPAEPLLLLEAFPVRGEIVCSLV
jgi:hypothetical protein